MFWMKLIFLDMLVILYLCPFQKIKFSAVCWHQDKDTHNICNQNQIISSMVDGIGSLSSQIQKWKIDDWFSLDCKQRRKMLLEYMLIKSIETCSKFVDTRNYLKLDRGWLGKT